MSKEPLKVGDRVRLIGFAHCGTNVEERKGVVTSLHGNRLLVKIPAFGLHYGVYASQCKLLKPKRPLREWWVNVYTYGYSTHYDSRENADKFAKDRIECILMREVREKRK